MTWEWTSLCWEDNIQAKHIKWLYPLYDTNCTYFWLRPLNRNAWQLRRWLSHKWFTFLPLQVRTEKVASSYHQQSTRDCHINRTSQTENKWRFYFSPLCLLAFFFFNKDKLSKALAHFLSNSRKARHACSFPGQFCHVRDFKSGGMEAVQEQEYDSTHGRIVQNQGDLPVPLLSKTIFNFLAATQTGFMQWSLLGQKSQSRA